MKRVKGIGGIFFRARDPGAHRTWYERHLGIDVEDWGVTAFTWANVTGNPTMGTILSLIGSADDDHFATSSSTLVVNYSGSTI